MKQFNFILLIFEKQHIDFGSVTYATMNDFKIAYTDWTMKKWWTDKVTDTFNTEAELATAIENSLENIPNSVIHDVDVVCTTAADNKCEVTFTGNPGNLEEIEVIFNTDSSATVTQFAKGNDEEVVCSNRGLCDYSTGLCKCFRGYYHNDCSVQSALAM